MLRFGLMARSLAGWTAVLSLCVVTGCGANRSEGVDLDTPDGGAGAGGEGGELPELPPPPPNCSTGDVVECTVYYEIGGVTSCFVGVQLCVDGAWETCTDQEEVDARLEELAAAGELGAGGVAGAGSAVGAAGGAGGARG